MCVQVYRKEDVILTDKYDVIVIGGGASGLFSSILLARNGKSVLLLEKNKILGKKLLITGKGRCNVTNNCDAETVLNNIPRNSKFLYSAVYSFLPSDTICFFEKLGVSLKIERGNRVFPVSDSASDIVKALCDEANRLGVTIINKKVTRLITKNNKVIGVKCSDKDYFSDSVIVSTGGKSYPKTGSTGDGYKFAENVGHTVTDIKPSLVPLETKQSFPGELMGLSLRNVKLSLWQRGKKKPVYSEQGEMLFTHFGVSGPLVLSASAHINSIDEKDYYIVIDLKPALDEKTLDKRILRDFSDNPNRNFSNVLKGLLPSKMIPVMIELSGIDGEEKVNNITKEQRKNLIELFKNLRIDIKGFRPIDEAIITRGGVSTKEIDPSTMESKLVSGLYFVGEVLDVDGYTGGFNLQIAFATANLAVHNICKF